MVGCRHAKSFCYNKVPNTQPHSKDLHNNDKWNCGRCSDCGRCTQSVFTDRLVLYKVECNIRCPCIPHSQMVNFSLEELLPVMLLYVRLHLLIYVHLNVLMYVFVCCVCVRVLWHLFTRSFRTLSRPRARVWNTVDCGVQLVLGLSYGYT